MDKVLLDSDILIEHLRGYEPSRQDLKRFETRDLQHFTSIEGLQVEKPYD